MSTSQYTYPPFHTIGAATVLVWDALAAGGAGAWSHFARVTDAAVLAAAEHATQQIVVKGQAQPIARRSRGRRYSISFRLLEDANPAALGLLLGDGAVQEKLSAQEASTSEAVRLYAGGYTELAHPYGILDGGLPPVTGLSGSAGGSGGAIPAAAYYYWVVPYVMDGACELLGKPARTAQVAVAAGQTVMLRFTAPRGYIPSGYKIAYTLSPALDGPLQLVVASACETEFVITTHAGAMPVQFAYDDGTVTVKRYDGQVLYTAGTDYELDVLRGLVKRLPGGAIGDGECVVVDYSYLRPAGVSTPLGDSVELERYRKLRLLQLAPDDAAARGDLSPATWRETGLDYEFDKVSISSADVRLPFSADDFSEGAGVTWECLYDPAAGRVGSVRSTYGVLAQY